MCNTISPLSDSNSRFEQTKHKSIPKTPVKSIKNVPQPTSVAENYMLNISLPPSKAIENDYTTQASVYIPRKARPAPSSTWKAPIPVAKSSNTLKASIESSRILPELPSSKFYLNHIVLKRIAFFLNKFVQ